LDDLHGFGNWELRGLRDGSRQEEFELNMNIEKEPWFYGCLSWLIPGAGQIYAGRVSKGLLFLFLWVSGSAAAYYMLGTTRFLGLLPAGCSYIFTAILLPIAATWDAVHFAKRQEVLPKGMPDSWFAVFFSLIFGPLGYVYLRKWAFLSLWVILAVLAALSSLLIKSRLCVHIIVFIFAVGVPVHVYLIACNKDRSIRDKATLTFFILLLFSGSNFVIGPYFDHRYGVWTVGSHGRSMEPTLGNKNEHYIIINSFVYIMNNPQISDIVAIKTSRVGHDPNALESAEATKESILIKRIIAAGGDIIEVNDGMVKVNGKVRRCYSHVSGDSYIRTTNWKNLLAQKGPYRVPEGKFFVMGDNIEISFDSRYFGAVPRDAIIGKVVKVYWPLSRARVLK
jgi:signal peptidase I